MVILIDFSNLVWSSFYGSLKYFKYTAEDCPKDFTGHIDFFHQKLIKILQSQPCNEYIFVLDCPPKQKFDIYSEYKKSRKRINFNPKPAVFKMLDAWKSTVVYAEGFEADDAIAAYVGNHLDTPITVATTDKDLWPLLEIPTVQIYNFHKDSFVTKQELFKAYGLTEYVQVRLYKTLWGDAGDGVPNLIPRMQKSLMPFVVQTDGTLNNFWTLVNKSWDELSDRCKEILLENKEKLKINYELVRLNFDCEYKKEYYRLPIEVEKEKAEEEIRLFLEGGL